MPRITKRTVDAIKPDDRERVVWDDDLKGFGVRVHPSGRKVYIVKTRYQGRIIKMTIGPHDAVSATYARVRAAEIITDARAGKNPKGRRSNAPTMRALGERFLKEYVPNHCKPSTAAEYRRSVEHFINPRIGKLRVPDVQRSNIAALHHDLRETPYQANRTLGVLSKMFTKPHSSASRSSASWVPSTVTPATMTRMASASASVASSWSQMSRLSSSPRSGLPPKRARFSQTAAVGDEV